MRHCSSPNCVVCAHEGETFPLIPGPTEPRAVGPYSTPDLAPAVVTYGDAAVDACWSPEGASECGDCPGCRRYQAARAKEDLIEVVSAPLAKFAEWLAPRLPKWVR